MTILILVIKRHLLESIVFYYQKIIKPNLDLLNLAKELGNVR